MVILGREKLCLIAEEIQYGFYSYERPYTVYPSRPEFAKLKFSQADIFFFSEK